MSIIHGYTGARERVVAHTVAEIAHQINRFSLVQLASPVLFLQELSDKIVADHRQKVRIANRGVLGLRDENFLLGCLAALL